VDLLKDVPRIKDALREAPWKIKVGLALGGGAARGLAHVGVIRALVREKIPIDVIVGTSMGAIIGGAFAATGDIEALEAKVRQVLSSEQFKKNRLSFLRESKKQRGGLLYSVANLVRRGIFYGVSTLRSSFLSAEEFADSIGAVVPRVNIEDLEHPKFGAVALDIESAEEVVLCHGSLLRASRASSAIPGILPPVPLNGRRLIDGGWIDKVPVIPAFHLGADVVIAVDISADLDEDDSELKRGIDIMMRANMIRDSVLVGIIKSMADVVIDPDVGGIHWADFGAVDRCIQAGDDATTRAVSQARHLLRRERLASLVRQRSGKRLAEQYLQRSASSRRGETAWRESTST
jgi:NTE family protein